MLLAALSFVDDLRGVPASVRLAAHLTASGVLTWHFVGPLHPVQLVLLSLAVTWILNLYNFMDGSDGFAGGMSVIGYATFSLAAWLSGASALAVLSLSVAAASLAFLLYNFSPARIFLGDVGSVPLGFLAGALGIVGWTNEVWPLWFPLLVFGPFVGDATVTLLRRALRGKPVWRAHREHYYQRMVRMGFGHRGTALMGYTAMVMCAVAALLGRGQSLPVQLAAFGAASAILAMMAIWIDVRWTRFQRELEKSA
jgi:UDP-N-acetylmuramyl pentapeptide phosphotransferase/UDP-N-acetylglucosamine-1-phosphate transferase